MLHVVADALLINVHVVQAHPAAAAEAAKLPPLCACDRVSIMVDHCSLRCQLSIIARSRSFTAISSDGKTLFMIFEKKIK
jgi:hypothetical protein